MLEKSIKALIIAAIATTLMGGAASAKGWKSEHHAPSCHKYKKKWLSTGRIRWWKKYKACLNPRKELEAVHMGKYSCKRSGCLRF